MSGPEHAKLPIWDDKSKEQKVDNLRSMLFDLYRYTLQQPMQKIESILDSHVPGDTKEEQDILIIRKLMRDNPNILNSNCENGHFTGSALVVDLKKGSFLLHFHKKLNKWLQFGGHPDYETDLSDIAMRETVEETGLPDLTFYKVRNSLIEPLDIDVHIIPARKGHPEHPHLDFRYLLTTERPQDLFEVREDESSKFKWFSFQDTKKVVDLVDPSLLRFILKAKTIIEA